MRFGEAADYFEHRDGWEDDMTKEFSVAGVCAKLVEVREVTCKGRRVCQNDERCLAWEELVLAKFA
jgi:hypothetical protein